MAIVDKKGDELPVDFIQFLEILNDDCNVLHINSIAHFIKLSPSDNKCNPSYSFRHTYIFFLILCVLIVLNSLYRGRWNDHFDVF